MAGVRFTKPQRVVVLLALEQYGRTALKAADKRAATEAIERVEAAEMAAPKRAKDHGIGWRAAAEAMSGVLGKRMVLPPNPTEQWCSRMSVRIREWGLSVEDCARIATAAQRWKGNISFESLVYKALVLLSESGSAPSGSASAPPVPVPMEDL